eukprot:2806850-Prymnesium_polylepis.1
MSSAHAPHRCSYPYSDTAATRPHFRTAEYESKSEPTPFFAPCPRMSPVPSCTLVPVGIGGWAWHWLSPCNHKPSRTDGCIVTDTHEPSLTSGHQAQSPVVGEMTRTPTLEHTAAAHAPQGDERTHFTGVRVLA